MTRTRDLNHRHKRRRSSIAAAVKRGAVSISSLLVIIASAAPADADVVTVSLSKMDISVQPVDQPFSVTVSIQKDQNNNVTIDIPSITQNFASSRDSPNFDPSKPFPSLWEPPDFGASPDTSHTYAPLPANYPLAGISTRLTTISRWNFDQRAGFRLSLWSAAALPPL